MLQPTAEKARVRCIRLYELASEGNFQGISCSHCIESASIVCHQNMFLPYVNECCRILTGFLCIRETYQQLRGLSLLVIGCHLSIYIKITVHLCVCEFVHVNLRKWFTDGVAIWTQRCR
jgi:hypothetical protein